MTPEERAEGWRNVNAMMELVKQEGDGQCERAFDFLLAERQLSIAEEREACMRAMCPYCLQGEPIVESAECIAMGHDSVICHPFGRDSEGRVTGHVGCAAAAIRARTPR